MINKTVTILCRNKDLFTIPYDYYQSMGKKYKFQNAVTQLSGLQKL